MTTPPPMMTTRRLNCIPLNDLHVLAVPTIAISTTTTTNRFDLKIGSQTPYYTCRCTSYYYYYYTHGIIVAVKNTLSLFVCFFANPLWSCGVEYNINTPLSEFITYSYTKMYNVHYTIVYLLCYFCIRIL